VLVGLTRGVVFRAGFAVLTLLLGAPFGGILGIVCQYSRLPAGIRAP
jgi:hypothetical protein